MITLAVLLVPFVFSIVFSRLIFRTGNPRPRTAPAERRQAVAAPVPPPPDATTRADSDASPDWTPLDDIQLDRLLKDASSGGSPGDR